MEPAKPTQDRRDELVRELAELIARGAATTSFLQPPVMPGRHAFPEPWKRTRGGVMALLRRLAWYAGFDDRAIVIQDERMGAAPPTERKPETRVVLTMVQPKQLQFTLSFVGEDNVAGTLAHELGVAHAALHRHERGDPYRIAELPTIAIEERDLARGSIATVVLGLGVLAANAAYQQYSREGRWNGAYVPLEYDVLRAGYLPMSELAYLLAVQAVVRSADTAPRGLEPPQRDEVDAWIAALRPRRDELRERLGIEAAAQVAEREAVVPFADIDIDDDPVALERRMAFRWQGNRGGMGLIAGMVFGASLALFVASRGTVPIFVVAGGGSGHVIGRRVRVARCSACVTIVARDAGRCPKCGAELRGDIARLADRLEAEEQLEGAASTELLAQGAAESHPDLAATPRDPS
ncbi:MAG TPA: hypothetical protein VFQ53_25875 [Kofleriaceae bacterium]|nr:hypothetical protein [Kofleriaceae bacterium]